MSTGIDRNPKVIAGLDGFASQALANEEVADSYVALLASLKLQLKLRARSSVLVTSARPGEGKTTVSSCLASIATLTGEKVILVDGDLRRRSLTTALGLSQKVGLGELLAGEVESKAVIQTIQQTIARLGTAQSYVIPSGRRSPKTLPAIAWTEARALFETAIEGYALVLIDSPPLLAANDALLLANLVEGVLLVVDAENSILNEIKLAKQQLDRSGIPVLGAILNRFDPRIHGPGRQPYRGYDVTEV
ncbi:MAG TPA: CpsD/CapB family tyrosine-protein kinase [Candidatus Binataceae bacterium]|nr:CpsD/CapB family tyrosine-protein kinase [Candidatus Binataceae bacterium]